MKFDRAHRIWLAAEQHVDVRPVLVHISVERTKDDRGIAVAANGFLMAIIPVILDENDVPGIVRADLFRMAARMPDPDPLHRRKSKVDYATLELGAERVTLADQSTHLRTTVVGADAQFVDWRRIMARAGSVAPVGEIGFDPRYITILGEALGVRPPERGLRLTFNGPQNPVVVERNTSLATDEPEPPYGFVMPQTITARLREQKVGAA